MSHQSKLPLQNPQRFHGWSEAQLPAPSGVLRPLRATFTSPPQPRCSFPPAGSFPPTGALPAPPALPSAPSVPSPARLCPGLCAGSGQVWGPKQTVSSRVSSLTAGPEQELPTVTGLSLCELLPPHHPTALGPELVVCLLCVLCTECQPFWAVLASSPHCPAPSGDGGGSEGRLRAGDPTDYGFPSHSQGPVSTYELRAGGHLLFRLSPQCPEPGDSLLHWGWILPLRGFSRGGRRGKDREVPEVEPLRVAQPVTSCPLCAFSSFLLELCLSKGVGWGWGRGGALGSSPPARALKTPTPAATASLGSWLASLSCL